MMLVVGLVLALGTASAAQPPRPSAERIAAQATLVQKRSARITSGTIASATFLHPNAPGNLIVVSVVWDNAGTVALSDSAGNGYVSAIGPNRDGAGGAAQVFYARNILGGPNTVSASFSNPIDGQGVLFVHEYEGLDPIAPLDTAIVASGSSPAMDSGVLRTARANELLFAAAESNGGSLTLVSPGWKSRFLGHGLMTADKTAARVGPQRIKARQDGSAWVLQLAAFRLADSAPPPPAYPLKVGPTGRYLVDQRNVPVQLTGDSPQALMVNLSEDEADAFFADREAAGFNSVWVNLLCGPYTGGRPDFSTYDGIVPFNVPGDLGTPNESYFVRVDDMLALAASHGLTVLLDPAETGSFLSVLLANGVAKSRDYGQYLGTRYRSFDNVVWMSGNDFQTWPDPGDDAVVQAVAQGIQDVDNRHIHTVELDYPVSGSLDDPTWAPLIQLNASYSYYPTYAQVLTDYNRPAAPPTFLVEANYEFEHNAEDEGTPAILRRQEYWSLLSGAAGQFYGNHYTWPFSEGWQDHLDTPGSIQMGHVTSLFASRPWFDLIPDQAHTVVTGGYGTYADRGALGDNDYLTAARTPDGALVMAYAPTPRTITVDMSSLGAAAFASWYDPSLGTFVAISGSPFPNAGSASFSPPGANGDGDGDWVLVLDAPSVPADTKPPSMPAGLSAQAVGDTYVTLGWTASKDDVAVAGYRLYRDGMPIGATRETSYTDDHLEPLTTYVYTVAAFDYAGNESDPSDPLQVRTSAPAPRFVQAGYAVPQSPVSSLSVSYPEAQATGDANIVAVGWNDTSSRIVSVTDSSGNVYQTAIPTFRGDGLSQAIYYAANIAGSGPGATQVTVVFDRPAVFVDLRVTEYAGLKASGPFAGGVSAKGTGVLATTGTLAIAAPNELLFAAGMTSGLFTAPGQGFVSRVITSPDGDIVEDAVAVGPGDYRASASLTGGTWLLQMAAFEAASE